MGILCGYCSILYNTVQQYVDSAWWAFKCIFTGVLDDSAPEKEIKMKQRTEIWMNSEILETIKLRDKMLCKFRKNGCNSVFDEYKVLRNKVET